MVGKRRLGTPREGRWLAAWLAIALAWPSLVWASVGCAALNGMAGTIDANGYVQLLNNDQLVNQGDLVTLSTPGSLLYDGSFLEMSVTNGAVSGSESRSGAAGDNLSNLGNSATTYSITCTSARPIVTGVSPTSGTVGTSVTITGTALLGATSVLFGSTPATSFTAYPLPSGSFIVASAPDGAGTVPITVITDAGSSQGGSFTFQAPTANAVSASVAYGSSDNPIALSISGTATSVSVAAQAAHGVARASGTSISYTPTAGFVGSDSFTYEAINHAGTSAPATVTVTVGAPPAPVVAAKSASTAYNTPVSIDLSSAITGSAISAVNVATAPAHGTVSVAGETLTYTPTATFYGGTDTFTVTATNPGGVSAPATVTVTVGSPVAPTVSATSISTSYNTAASINLASLISGVDVTSVTIVTQPAHGAAVVSGETVTYTPSSTFYGGSDSFTYTAAGAGGQSVSATVSVTVGLPAVPIVADAALSTPYNTAATVDLSGSITGVDVTAVNVSAQPAHGSVSVSGKSITYTPASTFYSGSDSFSYTASNPGGTSAPAKVSVSVTPSAVPTVVAHSVATTTNTTVLINAEAGASGPSPFTGLTVASQPGHGTATVSGDQISYQPSQGFIGTDSFTYSLSNHFGASQAATISVVVTAAGRASGHTTTVVTSPGAAVSVNLASVVPGTYTVATLLAVSPAGAGTASLSQPAALIYTPSASYTGLVQLTTQLTSASGSVVVDVLVLVTRQADPSKNADVLGVINAQTNAAQMFAQDQMDNIRSRLESLRDGSTALFTNALSVGINGKSLSSGAAGSTSASGMGVAGSAAQPNALTRPGMGASEGLNAAPFETAANTSTSAAPARLGPQGLGVWVGGTASFGSFDAYRQSAGFDSNAIAVTMGVDQRIGSHAVVGISLGYNHDDSSIGNDGAHSLAQGYNAALYGSYAPSAHTFVDGVLGGGGLSFQSQRYGENNGDLLSGHRYGDQWFASLTGGYEQTWSSWLLSPYGRLAWSLSRLNGYAESGDVTEALAYGGELVRSFQTILGLRASTQIKQSWGVLMPHVRLELGHDFQGNTDTTIGYALVPSAGSWNVLSNPYSANGNSVEAGFGLDVQWPADWVLTSEYDFLMQPHARDQMVRFEIRKKF